MIQKYLIAFVLLASHLLAADKPVVDIGRQYYEPTRAVVTPHIAWANPRAGEPLRVLFMGNRMRMREAVEIAQRLEMDYVFWGANAEKGANMLKPGYLRGGYYQGDEPGDKEARLRQLLDGADYDVIVMGGFDWRALPAFAKYEILRRVKAGTGLVKLTTGSYGALEDEYLSKASQHKEVVPLSVMAGVPWPVLPVFAGYSNTAAFINGTLASSTFGKGRIIKLKGYNVPGWEWQLIAPGFSANPLAGLWAEWWGRKTPSEKAAFPEYDMPIENIKRLDYDYYMAWLIKIMLFAAHRESDLELCENGAVQVVDRNALSALTFSVNCRTNHAGTGLAARYVVRDRDNVILATGRVDNVRLAPGTNRIVCAVSNVPAGPCFADLWIENAGGTLTFGSKALSVTGMPAIRQVGLSARSIKQTDGITLDVQLEGVGKGAAGLSLRIRQTDTLGRVVGKETRSVNSAAINIEWKPTCRPLTVYQFLDVDLLSGREWLDHRRLAFTVSDLYLTDSIRLAAWQEPSLSYLSFAAHDQLCQAGFEATGYFKLTDSMRHDYYGLGSNSTFFVGRVEIPALCNLRFMPPVARFTDAGIGEGGAWPKGFWLDSQARDREPMSFTNNIRFPCVNDPEYQRLLQQRVKAVVRYYDEFSSSEYFFDQEPSFTQSWHRPDKGEVCYCPHCQRYFHAYLAKIYPSLKALNEEYGSQYKRFEDVPLVKLDEARKDPRLAPIWVDFRMAMDSAHSGMYAALTEVMRKQRPNIRTGVTCPIWFGFQSGDAADMWKMSRWQTLAFPYKHAAGQMNCDFALPGSLVSQGDLSAWGVARSQNRVFIALNVWRELFEGANLFDVYYGDTGASLLAHDLSAYPMFGVLMENLREIKSGVGQMIHAARRDHGGAAILYSRSSVHCWALRSGELTGPDIDRNYRAWAALLQDSDCPYAFISYEQLAHGVLREGGYRLLILPLSQALAPEEIEAIRVFVKGGGAVLADLRPGVRDAHCKPYPDSALNEVFGVTQPATDTGCREDVIKLAVAGGASGKVLGRMLTDSGLKLAKGMAQGGMESGAPAYVRHAYGAGRAVLLNFAPLAYITRDVTDASIPEPRNANRDRLLACLKPLLRELAPRMEYAFEPEIDALRGQLFRDGALTYLGLYQEPPEPFIRYSDGTAKPLVDRATTLVTSNKVHLYDSRLGRYLGYGNRFPLFIRSDTPRLLALLPYVVQGLDVKVASPLKPGDVLSCKISLHASASPGRHYLQVSLKSPQGLPIRHYTRVIECVGGNAGAEFDLALNEKPGRYVLCVRDAATGMTAETFIDVQSPETTP